MSKKIYLIAVLCIFLSFSVKAQDYNPNEVIVKFNTKDDQAINAFMDRISPSSFSALFPRINNDLSLIYKLRFPSNSDIPSIIYKCKSDPIIQYAQPNFYNQLVKKIEKPNDFFYPNQWALEKIELLKAWEIEKGSEDIVIAVVDTGVDYNHEDLKSRIWVNKAEIPNNNIDDDGNGYIDDVIGWDFFDSPEIKLKTDHIDRDNDPMDEDGHGTHVAGIIAGIPNNSVGIAGITWGCKIMPLRAGSKIFEDDDLASAIVYAVENGAKIINMSWGDDDMSFIIRDVTEYAYKNGCILVGAAGNDNEQKIIYPAKFNHVISVGATNKADKKASFSNYGIGIDILAPGERIFGTVPNNSYSDWSGTSMATPIVSGVIALMLSKRKGLTNQEIVQILRQSADYIGESKFDRIGRINAYKALLITSSINAYISSPQNGNGADKLIDIIGYAGGIDFKRYELDYSLAENSSKWYRIKIGFEPIYDDVLAQWDVSEFKEGSYNLRLRSFAQNGIIAEDRITITVDHTPPKILEHKYNIRLINDEVRTILSIKTDDMTSVIIYYSDIDLKAFYLPSISKKHELDLTDNFKAYSLSNFRYYIKVINTAGLVTDTFDDGFSSIDIPSIYIPTSGLTKSKTAIPAIYPIATADFNGNGISEIVGMEKPSWDYSYVKIYEKTGSGLYSEVFKSPYEYYPRDVGDTDGDGLLEILGNRKDQTFLLESPSKGEYPTKKIWEGENLWGGQIDDLDLDGRKEIISSNIKNKSIDIFENRGNDTYIRVARLKNITEGDNINTISFAIGDFDDDNGKEIAFGDSDGDLIIYKCFDDDNYQIVWTGNINGITIKSLIKGDFDGDGDDEFAVAGELAESSHSVNKIYVYSIFDYSSQYQEIYSVQIVGTKDGCGLSAGDIDNDGIDELLAIVGDSAYIIKLSNRQMPYIWYHTTSYTNKILIDDVNKDGIKELFFNVDDELMAFNFDIEMSIRPPWKLKAVVSNENDIKLIWYGSSDSIAYKIYRGTDENDLKLISTINSSIYDEKIDIEKLIYQDKGLTPNIKYWYAVTSVNKEGKESLFSAKVSISLNPTPFIISAEYRHPSMLYVTFSEPIILPTNEINHFYIKTGISFVNPISAILDRDDKRVILNMPKLPAGEYTLYAYNIVDRDGNPINIEKNSISFIIPISKQDKYLDLDQMKVFPNPVIFGRSEKVQFLYLPSGTTIRIFDLNGRLVNTIKTEQNKAEWYLDNDSGEKVSSGIYIYSADFKKGRKAGEIAVIR
ncbi:TPA: T9SS type A sorting domain-containing protein [Candidatus Poribacteria bacterium]|nr:T9SS type A sorting domain-containing protein [Candidatus Poribacteria bacterium]